MAERGPAARFWVIVAAYNEAAAIARVVTDLKRSLVVLLKCNITIVRDEEVLKFGRKQQAQ